MSNVNEATEANKALARHLNWSLFIEMDNSDAWYFFYNSGDPKWDEIFLLTGVKCWTVGVYTMSRHFLRVPGWLGCCLWCTGELAAQSASSEWGWVPQGGSQSFRWMKMDCILYSIFLVISTTHHRSDSAIHTHIYTELIMQHSNTYIHIHTSMGFSILAKDITVHRLEELGIRPLTFHLLGNLLCLL